MSVPYHQVRLCLPVALTTPLVLPVQPPISLCPYLFFFCSQCVLALFSGLSALLAPEPSPYSILTLNISPLLDFNDLGVGRALLEENSWCLVMADYGG